MTDLTAVSLFAGVGGFDIALEQNGVKVVAAVEIDKNARGVLERRFPDTTLFEDVTEVTGDQLKKAGFVPERGIITGGFPCQDLSVAGKRAGLAGKRSGLYWEIIRLVDELAPAYIVLENVPGLLTSNGGRDMGAVIGALVDRRYGVSWRVLDAQNFGVPQRRRRVFIVGCAGDDGPTSSEVLALSEGLRGDHTQSRATRQETAGEPRQSSASTETERVISNCLPSELYHHNSLGNQDVNNGMLVLQSDKPALPNIPGRQRQTAFGQTGFSSYAEGQVTTLQASSYKRAEENVVVRENN